MGSRSEPLPEHSSVLRLTRLLSASQTDKRRDVMAAVYTAARECGLKVEDSRWDGIAISFDWVQFMQGERRFALLLHNASPFAALTSAIPDYFNLAFVDEPEFAAAVKRANAPFMLIPAAEWRRPLTQEDRIFLVSISKQHERDLKYWKPKTVGDVVFNWWD